MEVGIVLKIIEEDERFGYLGGVVNGTGMADGNVKARIKEKQDKLCSVETSVGYFLSIAGASSSNVNFKFGDLRVWQSLSSKGYSPNF